MELDLNYDRVDSEWAILQSYIYIHIFVAST